MTSPLTFSHPQVERTLSFKIEKQSSQSILPVHVLRGCLPKRSWTQK